MSKGVIPPGQLIERDVESIFGIPSSKLRTAQRFGLVESNLTAREDGKYVRAWTQGAIAQVYIAELMSEYLAVPFSAAIDVILYIRESMGRDANDHNICYPTIRGGNFRFWSHGGPGGVGLCPSVTLINRRYFYYTQFTQRKLVAEMLTREDGRLYIQKTDGDSQLPSHAISVSTYEPALAVEKFVGLVDNIP